MALRYVCTWVNWVLLKFWGSACEIQQCNAMQKDAAVMKCSFPWGCFSMNWSYLHVLVFELFLLVHPVFP